MCISCRRLVDHHKGRRMGSILRGRMWTGGRGSKTEFSWGYHTWMTPYSSTQRIFIKRLFINTSWLKYSFKQSSRLNDRVLWWYIRLFAGAVLVQVGRSALDPAFGRSSVRIRFAGGRGGIKPNGVVALRRRPTLKQLSNGLLVLYGTRYS